MPRGSPLLLKKLSSLHLLVGHFHISLRLWYRDFYYFYIFAPSARMPSSRCKDRCRVKCLDKYPDRCLDRWGRVSDNLVPCRVCLVAHRCSSNRYMYIQPWNHIGVRSVTAVHRCGMQSFNIDLEMFASVNLLHCHILAGQFAKCAPCRKCLQNCELSLQANFFRCTVLKLHSSQSFLAKK